MIFVPFFLFTLCLHRLFKSIQESEVIPKLCDGIGKGVKLKSVDGHQGIEIDCGGVACVFQFEAYRFIGNIREPPPHSFAVPPGFDPHTGTCTPAPTAYGIKLVPVHLNNQQENYANVPLPDNNQSNSEQQSAATTCSLSHGPPTTGVNNRSSGMDVAAEPQAFGAGSVPLTQFLTQANQTGGAALLALLPQQPVLSLPTFTHVPTESGSPSGLVQMNFPVASTDSQVTCTSTPGPTPCLPDTNTVFQPVAPGHSHTHHSTLTTEHAKGTTRFQQKQAIEASPCLSVGSLNAEEIISQVLTTSPNKNYNSAGIGSAGSAASQVRRLAASSQVPRDEARSTGTNV